jgi:3-methyladenine DNA glycosylase/8-oxoguanine DNA glycosylase
MHLPAHHHLRQQDPRLGEWIEQLGPLEVPARPNCEPFLALLESIAHQQLAGAAARAIWTRVLGLFDGDPPTPQRVIALGEAHLRSAGLSRSKALSMRDIAARALAGDVPSAERIAEMAEAEVYEQLTRIRGVGPWTVDMLMIFTLRRPDVMPVTDYGVRKGFQRLYRKRVLPTPKQILQTAERWRPYRSTAALYLWRIADAPPAPRSRPRTRPVTS